MYWLVKFLFFSHLLILIFLHNITMSPTLTPSTNFPSISPSPLFIITTIAGTGSASYSGDNGAASSAAVNFPWGVAVDTSGILFLLFFTIFCDLTSFLHRKCVHRRHLQSTYTQNNKFNWYYIHICRDWLDWLLW